MIVIPSSSKISQEGFQSPPTSAQPLPCQAWFPAGPRLPLTNRWLRAWPGWRMAVLAAPPQPSEGLSLLAVSLGGASRGGATSTPVWPSFPSPLSLADFCPLGLPDTMRIILGSECLSMSGLTETSSWGHSLEDRSHCTWRNRGGPRVGWVEEGERALMGRAQSWAVVWAPPMHA